MNDLNGSYTNPIWDNVTEGDVVMLTTHDFEKIATVVAAGEALSGGFWTVQGNHYSNTVWHLDSIWHKPSEVELPTEQGAYADRDGAIWMIPLFDGILVRAGTLTTADLNTNPASYAPFTKLEPVDVITARVLDAVREALWGDGAGFDQVSALIEKIEAQEK